MTAQNRHLKGDMNAIKMDVRGKTVIEAGDFVYRHSGDSYYLYPFSSQKAMSTTGACLVDIATNFMGVAMESSPSGVTEKITVATSGIFRYPLVWKSAVTVGAVVTAVSPHASGSGVSNQYVANSTDLATSSTTVYLGKIVRTDTSAVSFVDFSLITLVSSVTYNWAGNINV